MSAVEFRRPVLSRTLPAELARTYIESYFAHLHPVFPFVDRAEFEEKASVLDLSNPSASDAAFSALYHSILALGCQFHERHNFDPGQGEAWYLFQVSLGYIPDILAPRESLTGLQALVAMPQSIFANTTCCLQVDEMLLMEATRMALSLRYHRAVGNNEHRYNSACRRTFWVVYCMEKHMTFQNQRASMIPDCDIGCPVPETPEAIFGGFNWFFSTARFSRILSRAYTTLFSISAMTHSVQSSRSSLSKIEEQVENWRMTVPVEFRPGCPVDLHRLPSLSVKTVILRTHFAYYALVIALSRLKLYLNSREPAAQFQEARCKLLNAARTVIEMTQYIEVASYTPLFILAYLPLAALFILFEFVIHNPTHPETHINLSLLDVAAGHFGLLHYTSGGSLPSSMVAEFADIARQHVRDSSSSLDHQQPKTGFDMDHPSGGRSAREFSNAPLVSEGFESNDGVGFQADTAVSGEYALDLGQGFDTIALPDLDFRTLFGSVLPDLGVD
ncbi:fungal specific transcription factor domain-containing protein [Aspergillus melleus]|uniref:fungal specific transcription factor domain-containing protein n=1 Tax=Aspergillus melleus TaxID=138277 RepID=UPI001E8D3C9C|nr:uncharacterized protein LDX57_011764 [Aspergillus melleus]KAH8434126.1 hypothetical protein LDX57_011764 [Aspergillus melleus]